MANKKGVIKKATELFDIPGEAVSDLPTIEISGFRKIRIENHKGVMLYNDDKLEISGGKADIHIYGSSLEICAMTVDLLVITGEIFKIEFTY